MYINLGDINAFKYSKIKINMVQEVLEEKIMDEVRSAVIRYFETRLRRPDSKLTDLYPSTEMISSSSELRNIRNKFGQEYETYLNATINMLLEEGIIERYSEKFSDRPEANKFSNHFSYGGDLEIIASNLHEAVRNDDY